MMEFKKCITVGLFSIMLMPAAAAADILTETWTYRIDNWEFSEDIYFKAGDIISFDVTYDDEGTFSTIWGDGVNDIAQFGEDDDFVVYIDSPVQPGHVYSNAVFEFDSQIDQYLTSKTEILATSDNQASLSDLTGFSSGSYAADGVFMNFDDSLDVVADIEFGTWMTGGPGVEYIGTFVSRTEVAPVPEPATMLLFGTGLAGLAGYCRRRGIKK